MRKYLLLICILFVANTYAATRIQTMNYADQREIVSDGRPFVVSEKTHAVVMGSRSARTEKRRGTFCFSISNRAGKAVDFRPRHLRVTDQWGRPVRVLPMREAVGSRKETETRFYLDSRTISPEERYAANVVIEIPKQLERDLQSLHFYYEVDGEVHTFSFPCSRV